MLQWRRREGAGWSQTGLFCKAVVFRCQRICCDLLPQGSHRRISGSKKLCLMPSYQIVTWGCSWKRGWTCPSPEPAMPRADPQHGWQGWGDSGCPLDPWQRGGTKWSLRSLPTQNLPSPAKQAKLVPSSNFLILVHENEA